MTSKTIGGRIKEAREARGFSASDLARLTGVTPTAVWNWEKNGIRPRANAVAAICKTLGVSESYILTGATTPPNGGATNDSSPRNVDDILETAVADIAAALGIAADRVKIRFEIAQG
jgi:transcriptional regulator with XRE-family HTH domain